MLTQKQLEKIIKKYKILEPIELEKAIEKTANGKTSLEGHLIKNKIVSEELLYETAAQFFNVPFINLRDKEIPKETLELIPEPIAQAHHLIALEKKENSLEIACLDPEDIQTFEFIERKTGLNLIISLTSPESLKEALKKYHTTLEAAVKKITQKKKKEGGLKNLKELAGNLPIVRIVDAVLEYAIFEEASDIHIEPVEKEIDIRYRLDGILRKVMTFPKSVHSGLIARIKVLSNLKVDEHRLPQDGRLKIHTPKYKISFRVSIIPTFEGEKIVMRLLDEKSQMLSMEQLGLLTKPLTIVKRNIKKPHGIILVTGPTGSGKTTTLYSILNILNTPQVNITTIEDPIEYQIDGVNQCQVNPKIGFTFAKALRSFLRQDPNIIMVGEIRDKETAEIAIHAALTGHLVLSTLHTNDAPTTLPRLLEMGVPSFLLASTANIVIAQRLVRKICLNCIQSYNLDKKQIAELQKQIDVPAILKILTQEGAIVGTEKNLESLLFYRGKGCSQCGNQGYKGRIGIYEVLEVNQKMSDLISKQAPKEEIYKSARESGMITLLEDGFIKAKNGITTIEEILRVTKE